MSTPKTKPPIPVLGVTGDPNPAPWCLADLLPEPIDSGAISRHSDVVIPNSELATVDELPDLTDPDSDPEGETRLDTPIAKTTSADRPSIIVEPMCLEDPALDED